MPLLDIAGWTTQADVQAQAMLRRRTTNASTLIMNMLIKTTLSLTLEEDA